MIKTDTMRELAAVLPEEYEKWVPKIARMENASFMTVLGGHIYVIETEADAEVVLTLAQFDIIEHFENHTACVLINNNSGGPTFIFPKEIYAKYSEDFSQENYRVGTFDDSDVPF